MSQLVDQYGTPISSRKFFKASVNGDGRRPGENIRALDPFRKLLTYPDWKTGSYLSSRLFANNGIIKGTICQKSMYAVGNAWTPVFFGEAKDWGEEVKRILVEQWYPTCDVRGLNFDFRTGLYLDSITIDRDGDCIALLTRSENTGWPQIQRIPSRQIGQWNSSGGYGRSGREVVVDGRYKGLFIENGVIMNKSGRPIAFRKLGDEQGQFEDIPENSISHLFDPEWYEQSRGLPLMSASIEEFRDIAQSDEWERMAMLIASQIGIIEYNQTGTDEDPLDPANALDGDDNAVTENGLQVKTYADGRVVYMRANSGDKLEQFVNNRPGDDWEKFNDRQIRKAMAGANWPYSMVWKPDGSNGTVQRSDLNKAKMSVADRQSLLDGHAKRLLGYAVSVMLKEELIPPYPGKDKGGFLKWGFTKPAKITIDEGRDSASRREDFKMGLRNLTSIVEEEGEKTLEEHLYQRAREVAARKRIAREISEQTGEEIDDRDMMMLNPNDMAGNDSGASVGENEDGDAMSSEIEETKMQMDAYGVGVRAGALTPNNEDEAAFRERLRLPAMNGNVNSAWTEDKGVRRPITLIPPGGKAPTGGAAPASEDEN